MTLKIFQNLKTLVLSVKLAPKVINSNISSILFQNAEEQTIFFLRINSGSKYQIELGVSFLQSVSSNIVTFKAALELIE